MYKQFFFLWHSSNNMKIATPAEFASQIPSVIWNSELSIILLRLGLAMFYEHSVKDCGGLGKLVKTGTEINIELFLYMYGK